MEYFEVLLTDDRKNIKLLNATGGFIVDNTNNNNNDNKHTNKWYMHNPASVLVNETHKLQWDFSIQTDH